MPTTAQQYPTWAEASQGRRLGRTLRVLRDLQESLLPLGIHGTPEDFDRWVEADREASALLSESGR